MKKFKIVLTAIVMLFTVSAFATDPVEPVKISAAVKAAFENDFSKASQVSWEKTSEFYFASFKLNDANVDAAYNETGELVGMSRTVSTNLIPMSISLAIAERYAGYEVAKTATELTFEGSTRYYVTVKNATQALKLKAFANGELEVESKTKQ